MVSPCARISRVRHKTRHSIQTSQGTTKPRFAVQGLGNHRMGLSPTANPNVELQDPVEAEVAGPIIQSSHIGEAMVPQGMWC